VAGHHHTPGGPIVDSREALPAVNEAILAKNGLEQAGSDSKWYQVDVFIGIERHRAFPWLNLQRQDLSLETCPPFARGSALFCEKAHAKLHLLPLARRYRNSLATFSGRDGLPMWVIDVEVSHRPSGRSWVSTNFAHAHPKSRLTAMLVVSGWALRLRRFMFSLDRRLITILRIAAFDCLRCQYEPLFRPLPAGLYRTVNGRGNHLQHRVGRGSPTGVPGFGAQAAGVQYPVPE